VQQSVLRRDRLALVAAVVAPFLATAVMVPFRNSFANADAALVLVAVVVAVAAPGNRIAGYVAAASSAVWFDYFLTQPFERFTIASSSDVETTVLLLAIGIAVTELAVWGRREHAAASRRAAHLTGIHTVAETALSDHGGSAVARQAKEQLIRLLDLTSCQFQYGVAGLGAMARLHHDGRVTMGGKPWPTDARGLPRGGEVELLVESGGYLRGRFMMSAAENSCPTLENRLVVVALADQLGAALARTG
jgi:K+-sensing histidine kinase KdpD